MNELTFTSLIDMNKLELRALFSKAGQYDCPCRRKKMSSSDWKNYKNGYMQKIWKLLHETSFKYLDIPTDEEKNKVFNFFNTDVKRIPCSTCRSHYNKYLESRDLKEETKSKIKLVKWLIDLHNNINESNNKNTMSYEEVFELYNEDYNEYNKKYHIYTIKSEPVKVEPVKVEPVKVEPVKVEPVKLEPVKLEPVKLEPNKSEKIGPIRREDIIGLKPIDTDINVRLARFNTQLNKIVHKKVNNNKYQDDRSHFSFNMFNR